MPEMAELQQIIDLWKRASAAGDEFCLATVVGVEGSAYRRPGARMLMTASGSRAGTISGGCLEAEVAKKAWWLTAQGATVQRYSSFFDDDGDMPYGLGCGGTVLILLERGEAAALVLDALRRSIEQRVPSVIVTKKGTERPGTVLVLNEAGDTLFARDDDSEEQRVALGMAREVRKTRKSGHEAGFFVEYVAPPPALFIFGAGDDAQPLVEFAATLGWHVTVADGRSQLSRVERFPHASRVATLNETALDQAMSVGAEDAAVIMTHSYEQDRRLLRMLLPQDVKYLGILGPRRRTERLVDEIAPGLGLSPEDCMARLHTPVGLDLGGHSPASIALAIAAELQAVFAERPAPRLSSAQPVHA